MVLKLLISRYRGLLLPIKVRNWAAFRIFKRRRRAKIRPDNIAKYNQSACEMLSARLVYLGKVPLERYFRSAEPIS